MSPNGKATVLPPAAELYHICEHDFDRFGRMVQIAVLSGADDCMERTLEMGAVISFDKMIMVGRWPDK